MVVADPCEILYAADLATEMVFELWVISELHALVLERFRPRSAAVGRLPVFVDHLSHSMRLLAIGILLLVGSLREVRPVASASRKATSRQRGLAAIQMGVVRSTVA